MCPKLDLTHVSLLVPPTRTAGKWHLQGNTIDSQRRWTMRLLFSAAHLPLIWNQTGDGCQRPLCMLFWGVAYLGGALQLLGTESVVVNVPWPDWEQQGPGGGGWVCVYVDHTTLR